MSAGWRMRVPISLRWAMTIISSLNRGSVVAHGHTGLPWWVAAPKEIARRCAVAKQSIDIGSSPWTQAIAAARQRRVISLQADGSAMYSLQSLWTQAREKLPVTTIILKNSKYNILIGEYGNVGAVPGATAMSMLDLHDPALSWVSLANGMGVEAARATTLEQCADLMRASYKSDKPFVIDLVL